MNESEAVSNQALFANIFCCKQNNYSLRFLLNSIYTPKQNENLSEYKVVSVGETILDNESSNYVAKFMEDIIHTLLACNNLQLKKLSNISFLPTTQQPVSQNLGVYFSLKRYCS